jgi:hypothetical protein
MGRGTTQGPRGPEYRSGTRRRKEPRMVVGDGTGKVTGMKGSTVENGGPCQVLALPWSQDEAGGTPPKK